MARILISYRREDSAAYTGRLHDHLSQRFGRDNVFMDIATIRPGQDFSEIIERAVTSCDLLVAVIGKGWLTSSDAGSRRLTPRMISSERRSPSRSIAKLRSSLSLSVGRRCPRGWTCPMIFLLLAADAGAQRDTEVTDISNFLLDLGANPNGRDKDGWTPLLGAAHGGHPSAVRLLLDNGADVNATAFVPSLDMAGLPL